MHRQKRALCSGGAPTGAQALHVQTQKKQQCLRARCCRWGVSSARAPVCQAAHDTACMGNRCASQRRPCRRPQRYARNDHNSASQPHNTRMHARVRYTPVLQFMTASNSQAAHSRETQRTLACGEPHARQPAGLGSSSAAAARPARRRREAPARSLGRGQSTRKAQKQRLLATPQHTQSPKQGWRAERLAALATPLARTHERPLPSGRPGNSYTGPRAARP